jgi:hypothetical protein
VTNKTLETVLELATTPTDRTLHVLLAVDVNCLLPRF